MQHISIQDFQGWEGREEQDSINEWDTERQGAECSEGELRGQGSELGRKHRTGQRKGKAWRPIGL